MSNKKGILLVLVATAVLVGWLFSSALFRGEIIAWRDAGMFYYPLFNEIQNSWGQGTLPLWDPYENLGQPLAANATSSVWYPGKLLFLLAAWTPVSFETCFNFYIVSHFFLAACGLFLLMRHWRFSTGAAILSAITYTFSGSVLTQYSNVIFLIGAAWLPWTLLFGSILLQKRRVRDMVPPAGTLALSVLGGDPQMAYLSGLLLLGLAWVYYRCGRFPKIKDPKYPPKYYFWKKLIKGPVGLLAGTALLAGCLAAIQIIPSLEMTRDSVRRWNHVPLSLWEVPGTLFSSGEKDRPVTLASATNETPSRGGLNKAFEGLFCQNLVASGYPRTIYDYSVAPSQFLELVAPNSLGNMFQTKSLWTTGKGEMRWSLSLYLGIIPLLLAASVFALRNKRPPLFPKKKPFQTGVTRLAIRQWASWLAILALLAALGGYGLGWFRRFFLSLLGSEQNLAFADGDPVGGIYWLMNVLLPKFSSFRFPGKMLVPAMLGLAVLTGIGWQTARRQAALLRRGTKLAGLLLLLLLLVWVFPSLPFKTLLANGTDYKPEIALPFIKSGLLQPILILICFFAFLTYERKKRAGKRLSSCFRKSGILPVMILVIVDLVFAHTSLIGTIEKDQFQQEHYVASEIKRKANPDDLAAGVPIRYYRFEWSPYSLSQSEAPNLYQLLIRWHWGSLTPKLHYGTGLASVDYTGTMQTLEYWLLSDWAAAMKYSPDPIYAFAFLDTDFLIYPPELVVLKNHPKAFQISDAEARLLVDNQIGFPEIPDAPLPSNFSLWSVQLPASRIRIYHDCPQLDNPQTSLFDMLDGNNWGNPLAGEYARIVKYERNRLVIETKLTLPATLLLAEQYAPGWKAVCSPLSETSEGKSDSVSIPIDRSLGFCRKISLPAGDYRIIMSYQPFSFYYGAGLSLIGLLLAGQIYRSGKLPTGDPKEKAPRRGK